MFLLKRPLQIMATIILLAGSIPADTLLSKKLIRAMREEISGEIALRYTALISKYDRIQASQGWHESALAIKDELERIGYKNPLIEGWPSNGSRYYYTFRTPIGWRPRKAELWLLNPYKERLCSFEEIPLTLVKHSASTDVVAELIDVGNGTDSNDYKGKKVKGKIVLATGYSGSVARQAMLKRGALGVVCWYPPEVRPGFPNMIRYTAFWPKWEEREKIGFGFNVSKMQGWLLKRALDRGEKVKLRAMVDADFYDSSIEVLSVTMPGRTHPEEEILVIGHLCHPAPSANDNASGSGGMLEMARALKRLVDNKQLPAPRRTIRFLWVPEFYGTVPYIKAHLQRTRNTLAVFNCDMIGENLHLTGGVFTITRTPDSVPSYLNDVVIHFTKLVQSMGLSSLSGSTIPFLFRVQPFSSGSDHYIFNDGALRVPSVMLGHDDRFHHTNLDTMDKVDSSELRRICFLTLGSAYFLANASERDALNMARLVAGNGLSRFSHKYYQALEKIYEAGTQAQLFWAYKQALFVMENISLREARAVWSTKAFVNKSGMRKKIDEFNANLYVLRNQFRRDLLDTYRSICRKFRVEAKRVTLTKTEKNMNRLIPIRRQDFVCPLQRDYLEVKLGEKEVKKIKLDRNVAYEALNFVDGKRSLFEIYRAVSAEYGMQNINHVYTYFQLLEKADLLQLKSK